jgi:DNA-binding CsgD family transcriptional regulator
LRQPLSHRESDVLELIRRALPDKTIAGQLGITENTLKGLKRSLFAKLHVHSRSEILVKF